MEKKIFLLLCAFFSISFVYAQDSMTFVDLSNLCKANIPINLNINEDIVNSKDYTEQVVSITDNAGNKYTLESTISIIKNDTLTFVTNKNTYTVEIILKEAAKVEIFKDNIDSIQCLNSSITLSLKTNDYTENILWIISSGGSATTLNPTFTFNQVGEIYILVEAANSACPEHPSEDIINLLVKDKPSYNPDIVVDDSFPDILEACITCSIDLPDTNYFSTNMGTMAQREVIWTNKPEQVHSSYDIHGTVQIIVDSSNECGATRVEIDQYIDLELKALYDCYIDVDYFSSSHCYCAPLIFNIRNYNSVNVTLHSSDININASSIDAEFISCDTNSKNLYKYKYVPRKEGPFDVDIDYAIKCPSKTKPIIKQSLIEQYELTDIDTCSSISYSNCYGGIVYLTVSTPNNSNSRGEIFSEIVDVKILPPLDSKFELISKSDRNQNFYFVSKDTSMGNSIYDEIVLDVTYLLLDCDGSTQTLRRKIKIDTNSCNPYLRLNHRNYDSTCIGDTSIIYAEIYGDNAVIDSITILQKDSVNLFFHNSNTNESYSKMEYNLVSHTIDYEKNNLDISVYYTRANKQNVYNANMNLNIESCDPEFTHYVNFQSAPSEICPGSIVSIDIEMPNPSNNKETNIITWEVEPSSRLTVNEEDLYGENYHRYYDTIFTSTKYKYNITYNQGELIYNQSDSLYLEISESCFPKFVYNEYKICLKDTMQFYISKPSPFETLKEVIWDDRSEDIIEDPYNPFSYHIALNDPNKKFYSARILTQCRDTILTYRDTIFVNLAPELKAFTQDTVYICRRSNVDLRLYENTSILNNIFYPGNKPIRENVIADELIAVRAQANFRCNTMDVNNTFFDTIQIIIEDNVYLNLETITKSICKNDTIELTANSNGRLVWYKDGIIMDTVNWTDTLTDIIINSCTYNVKAFTSCDYNYVEEGNIVVNVLELPNILKTPDSIFSCPNSFIILEDYCLEEECDSTTYWLIDGYKKQAGDILNTPINYNTTAVFEGVKKNSCRKKANIVIKAVDTINYIHFIHNNDESDRIEATNYIFCLQANQIYTAVIEDGSSSYKWLVEVDGSYTTGNTFSFIPTKDTIIKVERTFNSSMDCKDTIIFKCFVPDLYFKQSTDSACENTSYMFKADSIAPDFLTNSCFWIFNEDTISKTKTLNIDNISINNDGLYRMVHTKDVCEFSNTLKLEVFPTPNIKVNTPNTICLGSDVNIKIESDIEVSSFTWIKPDGTFSFNESIDINNFSYADTGLYSFGASTKICSSFQSSIILYIQEKEVPIFSLNSDNIYCEQDRMCFSIDGIEDSSMYTWTILKNNSILFDTIIQGLNANTCITSILEYDNAYIQLIKNDNICKDTSLHQNLTVYHIPIFSLGADATICHNETIILNGPIGMREYIWSTGDISRTLEISKADNYSLYVSDENCSYIDDINIYTQFCGKLYFASAFTPNGDGANDEWSVFANGGNEDIQFELYVYNRIGTIVFNTKDINKKWDGNFKGEACPAGVYLFKCIAKSREKGNDISTNGRVVIIR